MATYYFVVLVVVLLCSQAEKYDYISDSLPGTEVLHSRTTHRFFILTSLVLILVAGLRYGVGGDYWGYYTGGLRYSSELQASINHLDEPGIKLLYSVIRHFTLDNAVPMFVFSLITIGLYLRVIFKNTYRLLMVTLMFLFLECWHGSFNAVRQCIAGAIIFSGYNYLKERNFVKYCLVVFIAFLFHRSAIIMIIPYFFVHSNFTLRHVLFLFAGSIIVLYSYGVLFSGVETLMQSEYELSNEYIWRSINPFRVAVAVLPAIFFIFAVFSNNIDLDEDAEFFLNVCIIHAAVMIAASNSTYLGRISIYTAPFLAIAICELCSRLKNNRKSTEIVIILMYGAYFLYSVGSSSSTNPFRWIWSR